MCKSKPVSVNSETWPIYRALLLFMINYSRICCVLHILCKWWHKYDVIIYSLSTWRFRWKTNILYNFWDRRRVLVQLLKMFPEKQWTFGGLNHLIRKIYIIGDIHRKPGSSQLRCARWSSWGSGIESGGRSAVPLLTETDRKTSRTSRNISHVCQQNH